MTQSELNDLINSKWLASPLAGQSALKYENLPIIQNESQITQRGGFGANFKVPLSTTGQEVPLEGMNTLFEFATASPYCYNVGLKKGFIQDECSAIGGYPKGALLWYRVPNLSGSRTAGTYNDAQTLRRSVTYQADTTIQYFDFLVESMVDNNTANFQSDPLLIDGVQWRALPNQIFQLASNSKGSGELYAHGKSQVRYLTARTGSLTAVTYPVSFSSVPMVDFYFTKTSVGGIFNHSSGTGVSHYVTDIMLNSLTHGLSVGSNEQLGGLLTGVWYN